MYFLKFAMSGVRRMVPSLVLGSLAVSLSAWAGTQPVPFKARISAQEVITFDPIRCPGTVLLGTTTGQGTASHMGAVKLLATDCPVFVFPGPPPAFSNGILILTAANGDEVHGVYQGVLIPVDIAAGVYTITGQYTINTGTGRFKNASGSGTLGGSITLGAGRATAEYEIKGTLSYTRD